MTGPAFAQTGAGSPSGAQSGARGKPPRSPTGAILLQRRARAPRPARAKPSPGPI